MRVHLKHSSNAVFTLFMIIHAPTIAFAGILVRFGLTAIAMLGVMSIAKAEEGLWNTYGNTRFGYSVCYPAGIFTPQGEADNGDGQRFIAADGAELLVWGSNNVLNASLDDQVGNQLSELKNPEFLPSYRAGRGDWRVVSGLWAEKIVYLKITLRRGQFVAFRISYDRALSGTYDAVVKRVSSCFPADGQP